MARETTVYTTDNCAYCMMVKKWLSANGLTYQEVNVQQQPERQAEAVGLSGQSGVPVTVVTEGDEKTVIIGWDLDALKRAFEGRRAEASVA